MGCLLFFSCKSSSNANYIARGSPRDCRQWSTRDGNHTTRHEVQCCTGCVTQRLYPWGKAWGNTLDRDAVLTDRYQVDRFPAHNNNDIWFVCRSACGKVYIWFVLSSCMGKKKENLIVRLFRVLPCLFWYEKNSSC